MCCFGKHWNAEDNKYYDKRIDFDNLNVPKIPKFMANCANEICEKLFSHHSKKSFDICIANVYTKGNRLGMHKDNAESKETIEFGFPVISMSFGLSAIFAYELNKKTHEIILENGDIVAFGDENRLLRHGIKNILSSELETLFNNQRLNLTFRKF